PTFVFLPGYGSSSSWWRHGLHAIAARGRVLMVDLTGFGEAPKPDDDRYSPYDLAEAVVEMIREHDLRRLTLVGQSLGGGIALLSALELYRDRPNRLERMVLLAPAAYRQRPPPFVWLSHRPRLASVLLRLVGPRRILRWTMRSVVHDPRSVTEDQVEEYSRAWRTREGRRAALAAGRQIIPDDIERRTDLYGALDVPTLLLWGDHDPVVPMWVAHRLQQQLPDARLVVLEGCGHMATDEHPLTSLAVVERFLDGEVA
ncbi:MAG: alpha/beta hydrolase, partial [Longimicrobiales bacterium]|nr:alpha/beta hydrolase [Longimicrobiales bacterium]